MMLPTIAVTLAMGALAWAGGPDTANTHKPVPIKRTPTAAIRKTSVSVPAARSAAVKRPATRATASSARRTAKAPVVRTTWRTRQTTPTADRYRVIQEALAARGYLSSEDANGAWEEISSRADFGIDGQNRFPLAHRFRARPEARFSCLSPANSGRQRSIGVGPQLVFSWHRRSCLLGGDFPETSRHLN